MSGIDSPIKTRQQHDLLQAMNSIRAVETKPAEVTTNYGRLCHKLAILVRTCGLCQTLAFIEDKKSKDDPRGNAYKLLHEHIAVVLGVRPPDLLKAVQDASLRDYMRQTRTILSAWVYYKRFAVSILGVEPSSEDVE